MRRRLETTSTMRRIAALLLLVLPAVVPKDLARAIHWWQQSARQGYAEAQAEKWATTAMARGFPDVPAVDLNPKTWQDC